MMKILRIVVGAYQTNCYLVFCERNRKGIIIDPGNDAEQIIQAVKGQNVEPEAVLLTHAHWDHVGALNEVRHAFSIPAYMSRKDLGVFEFSNQLLQNELGVKDALDPVENFVRQGEKLFFKMGTFEVIETPGHSPGSVCFLSENILFSGDCLFQGSIGRTDFESGSPLDMKDSLKKLMTLDDEILVLSGHGGPTSIGNERQTNPFIREIL